MIMLPGPMQATAIALALTFPLMLFLHARLPIHHSAGKRFRVVSGFSLVLFLTFCFVLPGPREPTDIISGLLLLITSLLFWHVVWSLLAWGFTVTLLTTLAHANRPMTRGQWISAYMQGGDLSDFANNRLSLLFKLGMARSTGGRLVLTSFGILTARLVGIARLATGLE